MHKHPRWLLRMASLQLIHPGFKSQPSWLFHLPLNHSASHQSSLFPLTPFLPTSIFHPTPLNSQSITSSNLPKLSVHYFLSSAHFLPLQYFLQHHSAHSLFPLLFPICFQYLSYTTLPYFNISSNPPISVHYFFCPLSLLAINISSDTTHLYHASTYTLDKA